LPFQDVNVPQIIQFKNQPDEITTPLERYPIFGFFEHADVVTINDQIMNLSQGGFRYDVNLDNGINSFDLVAFSGENELERYTKKVIYNPNFSTKEKKLLYSKGIAINLDDSYVLGLTEEFVSLTNRGDYAVDRYGNVYSTSSHSLSEPPLPLGGNVGYSVFSAEDMFCYVWRNKIRFFERTILSDELPIWIDNRNTVLLFGDRLAKYTRDRFEIVDLGTEIVTTSSEIKKLRPEWGSSNVDPTGILGFVTSYGWAFGALDVFWIETNETIFQKDYLSDYMGQIDFCDDGQAAIIGSYGNSFYGGGGVYVYDLNRHEITNFYHQFGASSVAVDSEGFVYISSRFVDHFCDGRIVQGLKNQRGIETLYLNNRGDLELVRSFFLNSSHEYSTGHRFLIKPRINDLRE